jgi:hypothetical protein
MTIQDVTDELRKHDGSMPDPGGPAGTIIPPPGTSGFLIRDPKGATDATGLPILPVTPGWGTTAGEIIARGIKGGAFSGKVFLPFLDKAGDKADDQDYNGVLKDMVRFLAARRFEVTDVDPQGKPFGRIADAIETIAKPGYGRRGRLPKAESEALRMTVLAKASQTPGLLRDIPALAHLCGTNERTARRIIAMERDKHAQSQPEKPDDE